MSDVKFKRGTKTEYEKLRKDPNTLYFVLDTQEVYLGNLKVADGRVNADGEVEGAIKGGFRVMLGEGKYDSD